MNWTWIIIIGILGIGVGYFLPMLAYRIVVWKQKQRGKEVVPHTSDHQIFKLVSALGTGLAWGWTTYTNESYIASAFICLFVATAILFTMVDWRIHIIPNEMILATVGLGVVYQLAVYGFKDFMIAVLCAAIILTLFIVLGLILGLNKIGAGDVKLAAVMGLVLGYPAILTGLLGMSVVLILYCFIGLLIGKLTHVSMFAFAPFMMFGMVSGLLYSVFL
jgi:leader peptidase (prepilin peptidase)/N-methyltransferase